MLDVLKGGPGLHIKLAANDIWLRPSSDPSSTDDGQLVGNILLNLKSKRKISSIEVSVTNRLQSRLPPTLTVTDFDLFKIKLELIEELKEYEAGAHEFKFRFVCPANMAPMERCKYGRSYLKISCIAKSPGMLTNIVAKDVYACTLCSQTDGTPEPLDIQVNDHLPNTGIFRLSAFTTAFVVAGAIFTQFQLDGPPAELRIVSFSASCSQDYTLRDPKDLDKVLAIPQHNEQIFHLDAAKLGRRVYTEGRHRFVKVAAGEPFKIKHKCRMPNSDRIRPSSFPESVTPIEISTRLIFELVYLDADDAPNRVKIARPVFLSSCTLWRDNVVLPTYELFDPYKDLSNVERFTPMCEWIACLCGFEDEHTIIKQLMSEADLDVVQSQLAIPPKDSKQEHSD